MAKQDGNVRFDIADADVMVTKLTLLGYKLVKYQEEIEEHSWRYGAAPVEYTGYNDVIAYADWPGRCAMLAIEEIMERTCERTSTTQK